MLTYEQAKELLKYDPYNGTLTWRRDRGRVRAGWPAGCIKSRSKICPLVVKINRQDYPGEVLAWLLYYREPAPRKIRAINGIRSDIRLQNLELVEENEPAPPPRIETRAVFNNKRKVWRARLDMEDPVVTIEFGQFKKEETAIAAREKVASWLGYVPSP